MSDMFFASLMAAPFLLIVSLGMFGLFLFPKNSL